MNTQLDNTCGPLLEIRNVDKYFNKRGQAIPVLKDITFDISPGECVGMVGASGSGKSTLARLLCRIHRQEKGRVCFKGEDIFTLSPKAYFSQVQMVFQDPLASFPPRMKVEHYLLEPFRNFKQMRGRRPKALAVELLERVGLDAGALSRYPNQLSGGQLQRIVFARAIGLNPSLVICDEATSALDATIQAQVITLFQRLRKDIGFASLFITHDLALAELLCDTIHVMDDGAIVETLTSGNISKEACHPATLSMIRASCGLSMATGMAVNR